MLIHPQFDPIALSLGPMQVHWYGLMYLLGFVLVMVLGRWRIRHYPHLREQGWTPRALDDLLFYGMLGVVLGGRLGYVFFYKPDWYFAHPLDIFRVWDGGMAFHGGLLGVMLAMWLFARRYQITWLMGGDFLAPLTATGLMAGRFGNFINGELYGRPASPDLPWAMVFPQAGDGQPRHPSQLYEMGLEGLLLFTVVWWFARRPRPAGQVGALFLVLYGIIRFLVEWTREPDAHLRDLVLNTGLSMGQWLSVPMIVIGVVLFVWAARRPAPTPVATAPKAHPQRRAPPSPPSQSKSRK